MPAHQRFAGGPSVLFDAAIIVASVTPDNAVVQVADAKCVKAFFERAANGRPWSREPEVRSAP